jgi:hypothetical protein
MASITHTRYLEYSIRKPDMFLLAWSKEIFNMSGQISSIANEEHEDTGRPRLERRVRKVEVRGSQVDVE